MFESIKNLLGFETAKQAPLDTKGAVILDVRTKSEYASGHIKGSVNIPLEQLSSVPDKLKDKNKPVITCCASGIRSASAMRFLKSNGYTNVQNGGGWKSLQSKIK
ncbi:MAG: rhodanese-like domain-containing protein [Saprospiraceae bacterium]